MNEVYDIMGGRESKRINSDRIYVDRKRNEFFDSMDYYIEESSQVTEDAWNTLNRWRDCMILGLRLPESCFNKYSSNRATLNFYVGLHEYSE
jgi:hypothetical protein